MERSRGMLDDVNLGEMPGLHLSAPEFDSLILTHGSSGRFRRGVLCPCVRIDTRTPDGSCPACRGFGRLYPDELDEPAVFLMSSRTKKGALLTPGEVEQGSVKITTPSGILPTQGDQIRPDDEEHVVSEILWVEGANRVSDHLLRPYRSSPDQRRLPNPAAAPRLLYPSPCCVEDVRFQDDDGEILRANPSDYTIKPDGRWLWHPGCGPSPGRAWTVRYRAPAVYVYLRTLPALRAEAGQDLPYMGVATRLDRLSPDDLGDPEEADHG